MYFEGVIIINKKILLTFLCLLMIITGCANKKPKVENVEITLLKPEIVIKEFFKYYNQKDLEGMNSLSTPWRHFSKTGWEFDNLDFIRVINISEDTNVANKEIYIRNNIHDKEKNYIINMDKEKFELENVIIFKVDFEAKYINSEIGPSDSGIDTNYYILIRKDKDSPWLIDSSGH